MYSDFCLSAVWCNIVLFLAPNCSAKEKKKKPWLSCWFPLNCWAQGLKLMKSFSAECFYSNCASGSGWGFACGILWHSFSWGILWHSFSWRRNNYDLTGTLPYNYLVRDFFSTSISNFRALRYKFSDRNTEHKRKHINFDLIKPAAVSQNISKSCKNYFELESARWHIGDIF